MISKTPAPPISKGRVAGAIIALTATLLAAYFAVDASRRNRQFDEWQVAEPTRFAVDLSLAGEYVAPLTQTCHTSHGESILLNLAEMPKAPAALLNGLKAKMTVVDAAGKPVISVDYPGRYVQTPQVIDDEIELGYFYPFPNGSYTFRLEVIEPAPALAGQIQTIVARYQLCGLEKMPALIGAGFSVVAGIVALIVGGWTAVGVRHDGWRSGPVASDAGK